MHAMSSRVTRRQLLKTAGSTGVLLGIASTGGVRSAVAGSADATDPLRGINDYVSKAMADWEVPGLAIAIVKEGQTVLARGFGVRNVGETASVDGQTVFAIRSVTKSFTAACIAILVDDEKVKWDDPVAKHLPEFQLFDPWVTREITVRDLLCHRSGLPLGNMLWSSGAFDREEIIRRVRFLEPTSSFRSRFGYQNIMYLVAGQLVAKIAGLSWDDVVRQRIFEPLKMIRSSTTIRDLPRDGNCATPCAKLDGKVQAIEWANRDSIAPAGSINSCAEEMAAW